MALQTLKPVQGVLDHYHTSAAKAVIPSVALKTARSCPASITSSTDTWVFFVQDLDRGGKSLHLGIVLGQAQRFVLAGDVVHLQALLVKIEFLRCFQRRKWPNQLTHTPFAEVTLPGV